MSLARDVTTVGAATLMSGLLGFMRDAGIAAILGAGVLSDAYFAALQIPNLFRRLLAEGALNSAFVPMWIRIREESGVEGTRRFGEKVLGAMARALGLVVVLCVVGAPLVVHVVAPGFAGTGERYPLAVTFVRLSMPYVALSGIVAVAASALNAQGRVGAAAFGLVVFNGMLVAVVIALLAARRAGDPSRRCGVVGGDGRGRGGATPVRRHCLDADRRATASGGVHLLAGDAPVPDPGVAGRRSPAASRNSS